MNKKNLAISEVTTAPSPATTGTTLSVQHPTRYSAVPFFGTAHPKGELPTPDNAEIVQVTAINATTSEFTIARAQRGSTAKSIAAGWLFFNGLYTEDLDDKVDGTVRLTVSATAPTAPEAGDVWFDTNETEDYLGYNSPVTKQVPSGAVDGSNTTYVTSSPYIANSLEVYLNGLRKGIANVTESNPANGTFTVDMPPATGDVLEVSYLKVVTTAGNATTIDGKSGSEIVPIGDIVMTLNAAPRANRLFMNGDTHNKVDYPLLWQHIVDNIAYGTTTATTFTLTNMRGRTPIMLDGVQTEFDTLAKTGGSKTHTHSLSDAGQAQVAMGSNVVVTRRIAGAQTYNESFRFTGTAQTTQANQPNATALMGSTDSGNTLSPYITVNFEVRAA